VERVLGCIFGWKLSLHVRACLPGWVFSGSERKKLIFLARGFFLACFISATNGLNIRRGEIKEGYWFVFKVILNLFLR